MDRETRIWLQGNNMMDNHNTFTTTPDATDALQFYEDNADFINRKRGIEEYKGRQINWDEIKALCIGHASHSKVFPHLEPYYSPETFMRCVAKVFDVSVDDMKLQWKNIIKIVK